MSCDSCFPHRSCWLPPVRVACGRLSQPRLSILDPTYRVSMLPNQKPLPGGRGVLFPQGGTLEIYLFFFFFRLRNIYFFFSRLWGNRILKIAQKETENGRAMFPSDADPSLGNDRVTGRNLGKPQHQLALYPMLLSYVIYIAQPLDVLPIYTAGHITDSVKYLKIL